jgi:SHS2 domain-containing protein
LSVYRWVDHTSEVELEISAGSEEEVFAAALAALAELLGVPGEPLEQHRVEVSAQDRPALLAAWLEELVFLAETEGFVAKRLNWIELGQDALSAEVGGLVGEPPPVVKAVTYHGLVFEHRDGGYVARVVLDV